MSLNTMNKTIKELTSGILYIALCITIVACVPVQQTGQSGQGTDYVSKKVLYLDDFVYESNVKTILFYPVVKDSKDPLDFPIVYIKNFENLRLEFDVMGDKYQNMNVKLIHCDANWKQSILNDFEFLNEYNEFSVDHYEMSLNVRNPYIHYFFIIPPVKVTGNYVLAVYHDRNPKDLILTRRFVVYDHQVFVTPDIKFPLDPSLRFTHQQVDFKINYAGLNIFNPREMVSVTVRQNGRWDNAKYNLKPLYIREDKKILDYNFFENENVFLGVNEYRIFDTRSVRFRGMNMSNTNFDNEKAEAYIMPESTRNLKTYVEFPDINGRFVIQNWETQMGSVEADYVRTYFTLKSPPLPDGNVYIFGLLSDWRIDPAFKCVYNNEEKAYKAMVLLKQGYYNYAYVVHRGGNEIDEKYFEGGYSQAQNVYDIIVYFRPIGARYDHVVGYARQDYFGTRQQ